MRMPLVQPVRWRGTWRGVLPSRRAELETYRQQLHRMRIQYREGALSDAPSQSEMAIRERQEKAVHREALWREYLERIRKQLEPANRPRLSANVSAASSEGFEEQQRAAARARWSHQLGRHQIARRKHVAQLVAQLEGPAGLITRETLGERIDQALAHPTNHGSLSPAQLIKKQQDLREARRAISMGMDADLTTCHPPPKHVIA